jgi:superfamily II DNA or RNA helicase
MNLRPYQVEAKNAVLSEWQGGRARTLLVLPTGTGKTIVFSAVIADRVTAGERVLVLAHRGELLEQAADKLRKSTGLMCAMEKAEESCLGSWFRVTVGSVQTLMRPQRLSQFSENYFGTIIIDEAHHCLSDSYQRVLEHFGGANVLGVTATPDRSDMRNLGQYFDSLAYEYTLPKATQEGYLSPIKALTVPLKLDISQVGVAAGDYKAGELGTALEPYLEQIAYHMQNYCAGRRTVVFLPLVATSQKFRDILEAHGFRAAEVNGNSADRAEVLADFQAGKYDVLCNSMLLTEGWDCPAVDCIIVLRPTKSRSLYCQMVGRGTRLAPGKDYLLLLDFLWHVERHELCRPASLICESADVAKKMTENLEAAAGCPEDIEAAEQRASADVVAEREEALAKQLREMRRRKQRLVDPLQFEMSIQAEDLSGYVPAFGWEAEAPTDRQRERLEKAGILPDEIDSAGKASKLLERLDKRRDAGLTTPKQIRFLEGRGFRHVGTWTFDSAKSLIDRIAANGWRTPKGITPAEYRPELMQTADGRLVGAETSKLFYWDGEVG